VKLVRLFRLQRRYQPLFWHGIWHALFHLVRFAPGVAGLWIRAWLLRRMAKKVGDRVQVEMDNWIWDGRELEIGSDVHLGRRNYFGGGPITIGDHVMLAGDIVIETTNHEWRDLGTYLDAQPVQRLPVVVEDNVWICNRVVINPGVRVGHGSVLGAGAVVTQNVPANSILAAPMARLQPRA
jgi:acetyltransferase-like isoleucine patch superfamily enzyme